MINVWWITFLGVVFIEGMGFGSYMYICQWFFVFLLFSEKFYLFSSHIFASVSPIYYLVSPSLTQFKIYEHVTDELFTYFCNKSCITMKELVLRHICVNSLKTQSLIIVLKNKIEYQEVHQIMYRSSTVDKQAK